MSSMHLLVAEISNVEVIVLVPDEGIAAIVFINTWGGNPSQMTRRLLEEASGL